LNSTELISASYNNNPIDNDQHEIYEQNMDNSNNYDSNEFIYEDEHDQDDYFEFNQKNSDNYDDEYSVNFNFQFSNLLLNFNFNLKKY
jgi:hypothetical protein